MNYLGVIPARCGSKGIPGKNIIDVCGKPMIFYTIEAAKRSRLDKIVVSTDCDEIAEVSISLGVEVIFRPQELASDAAPTLPVLRHALDALRESEFDAVVTLQPTSPLRRAFHIDEALKIFESTPNADSLVSVVKVPHNFTPSSLMKFEHGLLSNLDQSGRKIYRRQDKNIHYARNGAAIYITRKSRLDEYVFGGIICGYEMPTLDSFDVDDYYDLELVRCLIKCRNEDDE